MKTFRWGCFLTLIVSLIYPPQVALSAGVVNNPTDADLRAALTGGGTVTFNCDGTIVLTGAVAIASSTVIDASGHAITLSGGNAFRLFSVSSGVSATFIKLTLANGLAAGSNGVAGPPVTDGQPGMGGAILNNGGTVALTGCTVVSNLAMGGTGYTNSSTSVGGVAFGGAIYDLAGSAFVTNCSFFANRAIAGSGGYDFLNGAAGGDACGGAIYNQAGNVVVQNSTFSSGTTQGGPPGGNSGATVSHHAGSGLGGAIWVSNATVNCYNSTFTGNQALGAGLPYQGADKAGSGMGGGIFAANGTVNCFGCIFNTNTVMAGFKVHNGNVGSAQGGAIWSQASLSISQSSFFGNQAIGQGTGNVGTSDDRAGEGSGGAIFSSGALSLSGSTLTKNVARGGDGGTRLTSPCPGGIGRGGAICSLGTLQATNSTLTVNSATGGQGGSTGSSGAAGGDGAGGGFYNGGTMTLLNLTLATNSAISGPGGAIIGLPSAPSGLASGGAICNSNGTVNLYNTILAGPASSTNCWGTLSDLGHNLCSDNSAAFSAPGSLNNTDPVLGPLDDYGGPTLTMALLTGSPAIDGGNTATAPATDQRGRARPYGAAADIGAFESSAPFIVKGRLIGSTEVVVFNAGSTNVMLTNSGTFWFRTLPAGSCTITPVNADYVFAPNTRSYTLGPDQLNADFHAYNWNTINVYSISNPIVHLVYAGTNGLTYRVLNTTNLAGPWLPVATHFLSASNYFDVYLPETWPAGFYRAVSP